jgi:hypothetical protein
VRKWLSLSLAVVLLCLIACEARAPSFQEIRDSRFFDRRIEETPRQKVLRECTQESDRFRVECTHCHTTAKAEEIIGPDKLKLTKIGHRARIMRHSATFGLHRQCSECHQSKFTLTLRAQRLFGPHGKRRKEIEDLMRGYSIK